MKCHPAALLVNPFAAHRALTDGSFSRDPLADVSWAILELDGVGSTALEKANNVTIYQGQVFQIQNYLPSCNIERPGDLQAERPNEQTASSRVEGTPKIRSIQCWRFCPVSRLTPVISSRKRLRQRAKLQLPGDTSNEGERGKLHIPVRARWGTHHPQTQVHC